MASEFSALPERVRGECRLLAEFVIVLEEEERALTAGDTDRLAGITTRKTALAGRLHAAAAARNEAMAAAGLPADAAGLAAWREKAPADAASADELLELAARARELNRVNGALIALHLQATRAALATLGEAAGRSASVYDKDGRQQAPRTGYRLIDSV